MAKFYYVKKNLFDMPQGYVFAHCISEDFRLGAGIAVEFNNRYNMRERLENQYNDNKLDCTYVGKALKIDNVFNLITKYKCFEKPTYEDLRSSLKDMAAQVEAENIKRIAMPKIGAGLDKLKWTIVLSIIKEAFADNDDLEITICFLDDDPDYPEEDNDIEAFSDYFKN